MPNTVAHIAGIWLNIDGRFIQRCAVCGEKLIDSKNMDVPIPEGLTGTDGPVELRGTWKAGKVIRVTIDENPTRYLAVEEKEEDGQEYPKDGCLHTLVE